MLNTERLRPEEKILFDQFYRKVDSLFENQILDDFDLPTENLELFKNYKHVGYQQMIRITEGLKNAYIGVFQVEYTVPAAKHRIETFLDFQVWAFAYLPCNFGHIIVRLENFVDKLIEYLQPLEMNFPDDKEFCNRFFVLSKNHNKAIRLMNPSFRSEMKKILLKGFQVEILNNLLIIGDNKSLGNSDTIPLLSFAYNVSEIPY